MADKIRVDVALRQWLAPSRAKAQELIREGAVEILTADQWQTVTDDSALVDAADTGRLRLVDPAALEFVSRGGRKLAGALADFHITASGLTALDVGLSTGGVADCLLKAGAARVIGVDVGHGQLAEPLRGHPRLEAHDGVNARALSAFEPLRAHLGRLDLVVIDVSFVPLRLILPEAVKFLKPGGQALVLVKPQFEAGPEHIGKSGVVKDPELHRQIGDGVRRLACDLGLEVKDYRPSQLRGQDGNQEYFLYATQPH